MLSVYILYLDILNLFCRTYARVDQPQKQPEVTILTTPKEDVERTGVAIYLCNLQNFFPDAIKVVWNKDESEKELESEQGEIIHNENSNTYSLNSWITVRKSEVGKTFTCKYKHESIQNNWGKKLLENENVAEVSNNENQDNKCIDSYNNVTAGDTYVNPMTYRAAQLTYTLLLLKSFMYCPLLIFFKYKVKE